MYINITFAENKNCKTNRFYGEWKVCLTGSLILNHKKFGKNGEFLKI